MTRDSMHAPDMLYSYTSVKDDIQTVRRGYRELRQMAADEVVRLLLRLDGAEFVDVKLVAAHESRYLRYWWVCQRLDELERELEGGASPERVYKQIPLDLENNDDCRTWLQWMRSSRPELAEG